MVDTVGLAIAYYEALDEHAYARLQDLLTPSFVHERPDRQLAGRERFVTFMREERPLSDTIHEIHGVSESLAAPLSGREADVAWAEESAGDFSTHVRGRLLKSDGTLLTHFADSFAYSEGTIARIRTYTH